MNSPLPTHNTTADAGVADVLERAADRLSKPGAWTQDDDVNPRSGLHCMATAIGAECSEPGPGGPYRRAYDVVAALLPKTPQTVVDWNDAPERTQEEVVAKLRQAAAIAKATNK